MRATRVRFLRAHYNRIVAEAIEQGAFVGVSWRAFKRSWNTRKA